MKIWQSEYSKTVEFNNLNEHPPNIKSLDINSKYFKKNKIFKLIKEKTNIKN